MKTILLIISLICTVPGDAFAQQALLRFEDYKVPVYRASIHSPKWIRHHGNEWRDNLGKLVAAPQVNFAGRYFIAVHSCGTGCRYYTLTDLSSGRDLKVLDIFATAEPPPTTRDGHPYLTELFSRPSSNMLVARYHVDFGQGVEECRERIYLFDGARLKPITKTQRGCREV